jgi:acyl-CoA synthetase (AMP-forming)/AMP-acid ligase II
MPAFDAGQWLRAIEAERISPTPPAQVSRLMKAFPTARLCPGYGLTETCGIVSGLPHDYALVISGSPCWPSSGRTGGDRESPRSCGPRWSRRD